MPTGARLSARNYLIRTLPRTIRTEPSSARIIGHNLITKAVRPLLTADVTHAPSGPACSMNARSLLGDDLDGADGALAHAEDQVSAVQQVGSGGGGVL